MFVSKVDDKKKIFKDGFGIKTVFFLVLLPGQIFM